MEDSHFDEHIFQRGWFNHQLDFLFFFFWDFGLDALAIKLGFFSAAALISNPNAPFKEQLKSVKVEELWEELAAGVAVAGVVRWVLG